MKATLVLLSTLLVALPAAGKTNVVLIISDDQGWTDYGFMGHPQIRTPHLDKLASQGLLFPRGYVPSSLCCPSLASIITGQYPHQHKITCNDPPGNIQSANWRAGREQLDRSMEAAPTLPRLLARHGYVSFQAGKWWQDNFARGGFTHGMTTGDPKKGGRHGDQGLDIGRKTMQPVFDFIRQAQGDGKPFFVWYAPMLPHQPHNPPERLLAHYRGQAPNEHVAKYWAMVEWFDETCGQLLDFLDQQNLASNTLVLYVTDNGWIQAPNGGSVRSKLTPYDAGLRTPIILRWPQHIKPRRCDELAMSIDLHPTVLAALGIERPAGPSGINLLDEAAVAARKTICGECYLHTFVALDRPAANLLWRWIIADDWKLIVPHGAEAAKGKPELYNLAADPHEKSDLPAATAAPAADAPRPSRPNILFLLADDWAWPHASCLGTPVVQTPTFDRLAREGVLFRNAHVAAPSCSPSRAAILTGQWHWRLEQGANLHAFIPAKFAVYPDLLEKHGYFVGLAGKGYGPGDDKGRLHNAAGPNFKNFDAFLAARPKNKPFCFWFGSRHPHRPYQRGSGLKNGIDPAKIVVPPYLPDNDIVRGDICDYYFAAQSFDRQAGELIAALEKTGELDNTLIVISGDNGWPFPRCKATCYDTGTHQPLAVRWGARVKGGRVVDDFVSLADLAPTFLEAAGLTPPPEMTARSFLNVLLADASGQVDPARDHVLTGMERHVPNARTDGNQRGVGYPMRTIITRNFHYIRNFHPSRWPACDPPKGAMPGFDVLAGNTHAGFADVDAGPSKAWLLTHPEDPAFRRAFGKRPACELYDLRKDPFELKNVADDPAYADTVKKFDARLMAELRATNDPRAASGPPLPPGEGDLVQHFAEVQL